MNADAIDIDEAVERRCSHCFERVNQIRLVLDGVDPEDDFCSQRCADAWMTWWSAAKSVGVIS